jgi:hypothetical protein
MESYESERDRMIVQNSSQVLGRRHQGLTPPFSEFGLDIYESNTALQNQARLDKLSTTSSS